jgi:hypothetical protein
VALLHGSEIGGLGSVAIGRHPPVLIRIPLCPGHRTRRAGDRRGLRGTLSTPVSARSPRLSVKALESGGGVGGTWYWNRYPGARCDSESHFYWYTFSVLCNVPVAIEQHADWIADCFAHMRANGLERIEAQPDAVDKWVAEVNDVASKTLLPLAKHSWYLGANIPGKPRVFMPYAGGMVRYREICNDVVTRGYEGFSLA